ncbi:MAG: LTA synthase family protein, partial [Spirochaetia bacterium]|nr:LTA synthase family protein [Spirochaetia bacterium]
ANGYQHVSYFSGFVGTELNRICDLYLPGEGLAAEEMSEFDSVFFNTTIISGFAGLANIALKKKVGPHLAYVRRSQYILENIHLSAKLASPKFVFAHIILPHPPFVFDENGPTDRYVGTPGVAFHDGTQNSFPKDQYIKAYAAQAGYLHRQAKKMVSRLLAETGGKAIIIMQADHGPGSQWDVDSMEKTNLKERFSIFSAYYLPGDGKKLLYENITPVNNFRLILSHYLGMDYPLLQDDSYYSGWETPFMLTKIRRE